MIDYLDVSNEKNKKGDYKKTDVLSVSGEVGIVNQIEFQGRSFAGVSVENYGIVNEGDVVYTKSPLKANPYGIIKTNKGKAGIVSTLYAVYKPKENTDSNFVQIYFELDSRMNSYMHPLVNKGAKNDMKVSDENALKGNVTFPKINEQKAISNFITELDHLITLHQRKCDETKQLKKFMLQKMFPKNGEKNPEIRFEGFTDDWEQRKLGALMEDGIILEQSDGNHGELYPRSEEFVNEGIPYIAASSISSDGERIDFNLTKYLSMERAIQFRKGVAKNGDVLLAHNATVGPSVMLSMDYEFAILSTSLTLYRLDKEKMSPMFFLQAIRSGYFQKQLEVFMKQTTRSQVPILTQRNLQISYPINKVEQERIGEFLSNLDHLITLHQRKCEKLKELKKYMLRNMFI